MNHIVEEYLAQIQNILGQIKNVTGNANVKIQNKNLFDKNNFEYVNGKRLDDNGNIISDANSSYSLTLISVKPNTTYTIQGAQSEVTKTTRIYYYNNQKQFISRTKPFGTDSYSFTTLENCNYIGLQLRNSEYINVNIIQLEEGTTATPYVEHEEQNYPFTFEEGQRGMRGTTLQDNGIHQKRKQKIFDGTENWLADGDNMYITLEDAKGYNTPAVCNYFIYTEVTNNNYGYFKFANSSKNLIFFNAYAEKGSIVGWKAYLAEQYANGTPVIVEYELAESELENNIIPYNATQQAQYNAIKKATSYDDITYITSESDELGFDMNVVGLEKSVNQVLGGSY